MGFSNERNAFSQNRISTWATCFKDIKSTLATFCVFFFYIWPDSVLIHPVNVLLVYDNLCIIGFYCCKYALYTWLFVGFIYTWRGCVIKQSVNVLLLNDNFCILVFQFFKIALSEGRVLFFYILVNTKKQYNT